MPDPYTIIFGQMLQTYTVLIGVGILISIGVAGLLIYGRDLRAFAKVIDAALFAITGGLAGGRIGHVLLNWNYFVSNQDEILQVAAGGLDWHGALAGALVGVFAAAYVRRIPLSRMLDATSIGLPVMAFFAWWGCGAAACAYGAEVENLYSYPSYLVWEYRDVYGLYAPRFNTQSIGLLMSFLLLWVAAAIKYFDVLRGRRFWLMLALLSIVMFSIGFLRGDNNPVLSGLRADQWLDVIYGIIAFGMVLVPRERHAYAASSG